MTRKGVYRVAENVGSAYVTWHYAHATIAGAIAEARKVSNRHRTGRLAIAYCYDGEAEIIYTI